jgi:YHS domain-containing protein
MHIDPVCGMKSDPTEAEAAGMKSEYNGEVHYFCSSQCKKAFDKTPEQFINKAAAVQPK